MCINNKKPAETTYDLMLWRLKIKLGNNSLIQSHYFKKYLFHYKIAFRYCSKYSISIG